MNKITPRIFVVSIIFFVSLSPLTVLDVKAQEPIYLTIKPDGSVEPETNLLEQNGTTYTFKGDIYGTIWLQRGSLTIDGAGFSLIGRKFINETGLSLSGPDLSHRRCRGVLVKNLRLSNSSVYTVGGSHNSFIGNYFDRSGIHIMSSENYVGDLIEHNIFVDSTIFVDYNRYGIDVITENNFFNSHVMYGLSEEPIVDRNYWSNYLAKYPDAEELNNSGIWDTPHVDDEFESVFSGIDYHPLVKPISGFEIADFNIPIFIPTPSPTLIPGPEPFPTILVLTSVVIIVIVSVGLGIFAYFKKRRS